MILVFDMGNTDTMMGLFKSGDLVDHWRFSTRPERSVDEIGLLVRGLVRESGFDVESLRTAVVASVVPPLTPALVESCERHIGADTLVVDASTPLPVRLEVDEPLTVGADRIINTLAASRLYRRDTIVVDLGTATTFDCVTAAGSFVGGVIAPGVQTGAETLVRRTAKLPRVDLEQPDRVIGRRTEACLRAGIFYSAVDSMDGMVQRIKKEWGRPQAFVVATGGFASLLAPHCRTVDHVEPFLSLYGLELAARQQRPAATGSRLSPMKRPSTRRSSG